MWLLTLKSKHLDFGAIIQNAQGEVIEVLSNKISGLIFPKMADARVVGVALDRARNVGLNI